MEKILTATWDDPNSHTLKVYKKHGGYETLKKAVEMAKPDIIAEVKKGNLLGRGGAGFPAGVKWGFLPKDSDKPRYLVINADEGEPGTFKDRQILEQDPHRLIEGCAICSYALDIKTCYIYIRGELRIESGLVVENAIEEAKKAGYLGKNILKKKGFDLEIFVHYGAGAYVCGEETALLESIEGKTGQPRLKPPFPAVIGLWNCPTIINNVETMTCVRSIIEHGGDWWAEIGNEGGGGTKLYGASGHVKNPGVFEAPHGTTLREIIYDFAGGLPEGRELKAVIPGGSSCPVLLPDQLDIKMDVKSVQAAGSMFGTGCVLVLDDQTCMVRYAARIAHFFHHESCGQCTPCRESGGWLERTISEIENGGGSEEDLDLIVDVCSNVEFKTICALGDAMAAPIRSLVQTFRDEFLEHIKTGKCPFPAW